MTFEDRVCQWQTLQLYDDRRFCGYSLMSGLEYFTLALINPPRRSLDDRNASFRRRLTKALARIHG